MTKKKTIVAPIEMPMPADLFKEIDAATAVAERPSAKIEPLPDRDILTGLCTSAILVATTASFLALAVKLWIWTLS